MIELQNDGRKLTSGYNDFIERFSRLIITLFYWEKLPNKTGEIILARKHTTKLPNYIC